MQSPTATRSWSAPRTAIPAVLTNCVRRMLERKVEGVAVMTFGEEEPVLDQLVYHDVPIVLAEFKLD